MHLFVIIRNLQIKFIFCFLGILDYQLEEILPTFLCVHWVKLEIGVNEDFVEPTVAAVLQAGATAGKLFILPIEDVVRIRTGEHGPEAI